jgi:hypothetical protein
VQPANLRSIMSPRIHDRRKEDRTHSIVEQIRT